MSYFKFYNKEDILSVTKIRRFETKLGERIQVIKPSDQLSDSLKQSTAKYVVLGIPEDVGVKANGGIGGADSAWVAFCMLSSIFKAMIFLKEVKCYYWAILIFR